MNTAKTFIRFFLSCIVLFGSEEHMLSAQAEQPLDFRPLATIRKSATGVDYHPCMNVLLLSDNRDTAGTPNNINFVLPDGREFPFSSLWGIPEEVRIFPVKENAN